MDGVHITIKVDKNIQVASSMTKSTAMEDTTSFREQNIKGIGAVEWNTESESLNSPIKMSTKGSSPKMTSMEKEPTSITMETCLKETSSMAKDTELELSQVLTADSK